jgi:hypothetical protein
MLKHKDFCPYVADNSIKMLMVLRLLLALLNLPPLSHTHTHTPLSHTQAPGQPQSGQPPLQLNITLPINLNPIPAPHLNMKRSLLPIPQTNECHYQNSLCFYAEYNIVCTFAIVAAVSYSW